MRLIYGKSGMKLKTNKNHVIKVIFDMKCYYNHKKKVVTKKFNNDAYLFIFHFKGDDNSV